MPAPFALRLCGFREGKGTPNTSDSSEKFSVELGHALFEAMNVPKRSRPPSNLDKIMSKLLAGDLQKRLAGTKLKVEPEQPLKSFAQFRHVGLVRELKTDTSRRVTKATKQIRQFTERKVQGPRDIERRDRILEELDAALLEESEDRMRIVDELGEESLLKLDVTASRVSIFGGTPHLEMGLSLKWTLRTDRAQDCRSQGAKMAALRRGRMPHFAAVTMEPRPYMLRILGGGSGEVDCVYHLDLPALTAAIEATTKGRPRRRETADTFRRLVDQRRLRDYDELVSYAKTL